MNLPGNLLDLLIQNNIFIRHIIGKHGFDDIISLVKVDRTLYRELHSYNCIPFPLSEKIKKNIIFDDQIQKIDEDDNFFHKPYFGINQIKYKYYFCCLSHIFLLFDIDCITLNELLSIPRPNVKVTDDDTIQNMKDETIKVDNILDSKNDEINDNIPSQSNSTNTSSPNIKNNDGVTHIDNMLFNYLDSNTFDFDTINSSILTQGLTENEIRYIIRHLCDILEYLHDQEHVHSNLDPEHILISLSDHQIYISDLFNIFPDKEYDVLLQIDFPDNTYVNGGDSQDQYHTGGIPPPGEKQIGDVFFDVFAQLPVLPKRYRYILTKLHYYYNYNHDDLNKFINNIIQNDQQIDLSVDMILRLHNRINSSGFFLYYFHNIFQLGQLMVKLSFVEIPNQLIECERYTYQLLLDCFKTKSYSNKFINFVIECLVFDPFSSSNIKSLKNHQFLRTKS